ncbi:MAG: chloramphenicol acetyltransferase [Propionivibrio sp.]
MREIDIESWERREHYRFFMRMDYPQYNLCFDLDVSQLVPFCRARGLSFYYALLYHSTRAANEVEAFRYRARGDKVVLHDSLHPSFTDMSKDSELFRIVTVELPETLAAFVERAGARSREQVHPFDMTGFDGRDDLIYYTSIPWLSFTQLTHTVTLAREDSVPRLSWGKYWEEGGRFILPYSVQVHHAFVNGLHIARFKTVLEAALNAL